jgi:2-hydroxy-3-oxopropionate reductase
VTPTTNHTERAATTIAVLGIGLMGKPMATRLIRAGYRVVVWNRTPDKAETLRDLGAEIAGTPAEAVASAQLIITMLEAGPAVLEVVTAAIPAIPRNALLIDMSSIQPSEAKALHQMAADHGIASLDAPVSGGVVGAQAGSLAIMVGGHEPIFARAEPMFAALGRATLVGGPGAGQIAKLCNQLIVGATLNIVAEALLLAEAAGADPVAVRTALRGGFAESRILEVHGQRMLERDFRPGGQVKSQAKDMQNILSLASEVDVALPVTALVSAHYQSILSAVPCADQSAILLALEQSNPGLRLGKAPDRLE